MSDFDRHDGANRRKVLECMTWVGTASITFKQDEQRLAIIDTPLQA